jgi:CRISPR-associated endoribonuclease Cas6
MWDFITSVSLLRYLIVWRVTGSLVILPRYLPISLSQVLGALIAERLPTSQAREWREVAAAETRAESAPETRGVPLASQAESQTAAWPLEAVFLAYPGKRTYGPGELIPWELKLLGDSADHALFMELILPAMEAAASSTDPRWNHSHWLWGRFEVQAVFAARGLRWEPVVSEGRLNANYRATPAQWAEGLTLGSAGKRSFQHLNWLTPFDLPRSAATPNAEPRSAAPTLQDILDALMERMTLFLPGKRATPEANAQRVWASLGPEEQTAIWLALQQAPLAAPDRQRLKPAPKGLPGRWLGTQTFSAIPEQLLPYLELASILHIGKQTQLGCGTFMLR